MRAKPFKIMPFNKQASDLVDKIRQKFQRNSKTLDQATKLCAYSNRIKKYSGLPSCNMIVLSRIFNDGQNNIISRDFRWILPNKPASKYYYRKFRDIRHYIPTTARSVTVVFGAERAQFPGGTIRVIFANDYNRIIRTTKMTVLPRCIGNCWEFPIPPFATEISTSIRIHSVSDDCIQKKIEKTKHSMLLRSAMKKTEK